MRNFITGIILMGMATGCTKPAAPSSESTALGESTTLSESTTPGTEAGLDTETDSTPAIDAAAKAETEMKTPGGPISVGDLAPNFEGLIGVDDKAHSLADYADAEAVAIVFSCNQCPVAVAYEDRLSALHDDYAGKGVQLLMVNVSNLEDDKLPAMKERAASKGFEFPYLYDSTQQIGRDYGATVTPHVFLLDAQRRLAYVGAVDDNMNQGEVTQHFLRDAIDAVLAGEMLSKAETKPFGCGIAYE